MANENYRREIIVSASPSAIYKALTEEVDKWWTAASNIISKVGDVVTFSFKPTFWTMRAKQMVPDKLLELECIEANHVHEGFSESIREEWVGTVLKWRIEQQADRTKVYFEHEGLVPTLECYDICEAGWDYFFLNSLKRYLETGIGTPGGIEK